MARAVMVKPGLFKDDVLGMLVGYVEHLKREAAAAWDDADTIRGTA